VAYVHSRDGGTCVICLQCKWSADRPVDAMKTFGEVLRQSP
jgi:hypothetical protein